MRRFTTKFTKVQKTQRKGPFLRLLHFCEFCGEFSFYGEKSGAFPNASIMKNALCKASCSVRRMPIWLRRKTFNVRPSSIWILSRLRTRPAFMLHRRRHEFWGSRSTFLGKVKSRCDLRSLSSNNPLWLDYFVSILCSLV
jgi:hypothetical protein